jgi:putative transposase
MSIREVKFVQGNYYHLYNRGMLKLPICYDKRDYYRLIERMLLIAAEIKVAVIAWCIMPNHFHLLVRQDGDIPAGKIPTRLFNSYSKYFNRKYERIGRLCESTFKATHVKTDAYLRTMCKYVHANPVMAGLVDKAGNWPYDNYQDFMCAEPGPDEQLPEDYRNPERYRQALEAYIIEQKEARERGKAAASEEEAELEASAYYADEVVAAFNRVPEALKGKLPVAPVISLVAKGAEPASQGAEDRADPPWMTARIADEDAQAAMAMEPLDLDALREVLVQLEGRTAAGSPG